MKNYTNPNWVGHRITEGKTLKYDSETRNQCIVPILSQQAIHSELVNISYSTLMTVPSFLFFRLYLVFHRNRMLNSVVQTTVRHCCWHETFENISSNIANNLHYS